METPTFRQGLAEALRKTHDDIRANKDGCLEKSEAKIGKGSKQILLCQAEVLYLLAQRIAE